MDATMIDTLRYANRLKDAGVEARQAEAMARAINDEMGSGLATKDHLDHAVTGLRGEIERTAAGLRGEIERTASGLRGEIERTTGELRGEIIRVDGKIDALNGKFETQGRYMFLVLALIAALGLYNAAAPHFAPTTAAAGQASPPEAVSPRTSGPAPSKASSSR